jgi:hypothetical protein
MGPSTQQFFFSSSDVIATTCFGRTTIIKCHTVVLSQAVCLCLQRPGSSGGHQSLKNAALARQGSPHYWKISKENISP